MTKKTDNTNLIVNGREVTLLNIDTDNAAWGDLLTRLSDSRTSFSQALHEVCINALHAYQEHANQRWIIESLERFEALGDIEMVQGLMKYYRAMTMVNINGNHAPALAITYKADDHAFEVSNNKAFKGLNAHEKFDLTKVESTTLEQYQAESKKKDEGVKMAAKEVSSFVADIHKFLDARINQLKYDITINGNETLQPLLDELSAYREGAIFESAGKLGLTEVSYPQSASKIKEALKNPHLHSVNGESGADEQASPREDVASESEITDEVKQGAVAAQ